VPTISALRRRADEVVEQVLRENESRWETLSPADRERVEVMARAVVSRLLHEPTVRLKDRSSYHYLHTIRELFGLDPEPVAEAEVVQLRDQTRHAR
jgi:glutamyl-tRNA reductase